jgi:hypothetical protein
MEQREFRETSLADYIGNYFKKLQLNIIQIGAMIAGNNGLDDENKEKCLNQLKNEFRHFFHRFDPYTEELKFRITDELHYNIAIDTDYLFRRIEGQFNGIIDTFYQDVCRKLDKDIFIRDSEWKNTKHPRDIYLHNADRELERYRNDIMQLKKVAKFQQVIDTEKLKDYFNSTFKGMGNNNLNYFQSFVSELEKDRTAKAFAQIALMCYDGKQMNHRKPKTWSEWYGIFCECVQCEKKTYKPKDLNPIPENIEKLFNYLM